MSEIFFPLALAFAGFITAFAAYRGIRRGGARFYTLEREAILRRASLSLTSSVLLFLAAISLLVYDRQQRLAVDAAASGEIIEGVATVTPLPNVEQFPPLATETPTPDPSIPTATPTPVICRAVVESVNGLRLRDAPGGAEIDILADGSILTLLTEEEPVDVNGVIWRKVRPVIGEDGWVAEEFIIIGAPCNRQ
jgi:hypothetical protein